MNLRLLTDRAAYAWVAFLIPPLAILGHAWAPGEAYFKGQDLGVLAALLLTGVAIALWLPYRSRDRWQPLAIAALLLLLVAWLAQIVRIQLDGALFTVASFCLPLLLLAFLVKPPSAADLRIAGLCLGYGIAVVALISIPLGMLGWMPSGFEGADNAECRTTVLCDLLGGVNRWSGPFGSVNYAAPIGGLLIVLGAAQRRRHAWPLVATGVLIMVLSQGRSAVFAAVAGLTIVILWGARVSHSPARRAIRAVVLVVLGVLVLVYLVVFDPTLNGRTPYWREFLSMWNDQRWTGIGTSGIDQYMAAHEDLGTVSHAHSVILDQLVRWGPLLAALTIAVFVLVLLVTGRALPRVGPGPLAVTVAIIVAGLVETVHDWTYWSPYVALLAWAAMSGGLRRQPSSAEVPPEDRAALRG